MGASIPVPMASCPECSRPLVPGQRYCLRCGRRVGPPIVQWRAAPRPDPPRRGTAPPATRGVPRPKTAAALLLAALGTGTVLGAAVAPAPTAADAAAPVIAYAPPAATPAPTPTATATPARAISLPDDVPAPVATATPTPTATPAPTPAPHVASTTPTDTAPPRPAEHQDARPPTIKHAVLVSLTGHHYSAAFGDASPAHYLARELAAKGTLLARYRGVAGDATANALALMAGVSDPGDDAASLPFELGTVGKTWKAYVEGAAAPCTRGPRDPFPLLPMLPDCHTADLSLASLVPDLAHADTAPSLAYVIPSGCHDGSDLACTDAWLRAWIPKILDSAAFADDGLLVVLFDGDAPDADPAKGAHVGALLVSSFVRRGAVSDRSYDHLDLLRTLAAMLGVDPPGGAAGKGAVAFGDDVFR